MCDECYRLDKRKYRANLFCKTENCMGNLVEIDDNFALSISTLNKKGYFTTYCCAGHLHHPHTYIAFRNGVILPNLPKEFSYDRDNHPNINWVRWEEDGTLCNIQIFTNRKSGHITKRNIVK